MRKENRLDQLVVDFRNQRKKLKELDQRLKYGFSSFRPGEHFINHLYCQLNNLQQGFEGQRLIRVCSQEDFTDGHIGSCIGNYKLNRQFYDELKSFPFVCGGAVEAFFARRQPLRDTAPEYWKLTNETTTKILRIIGDTISKLEELAEKEGVEAKEKQRLLRAEYEEAACIVQTLETQIEIAHKSYAEPKSLKRILEIHRLTIQHLIIDYEIPKAGGVYLIWSSGELIYIGQSENIRRRMHSHHIFDRKHHQLGVIAITDKPKRLIVECELIEKLSPKCNKKIGIHPNQRYITRKGRNRCKTTMNSAP